ncbi:uncharacterized protein [Dermacentor andersoni]|uniref:uncharacterized protein isoform X2 n=1 Tax=Dermacentor andersoni TaxID=34620 RepID=UPI0024161838|nr:uncharacterized protein LOC126544511 isoform X2 [Dermacentor andersoni]
MASSSEQAEGASEEEQAKQVKAWLHKMLKKDLNFRMDEKMFIALRKLMTLQEAAEADARDQIKVLEARSKFFVEKAERLEAGLRAGNIAPEQLPEEACSTLKELAQAGTLLDCHHLDTERFEEKLVRLCQEHDQLQVQRSELQASVENIDRLTHTMEQHLSEVVDKNKEADEEWKPRDWKTLEKRYRSKLTTLKEHQGSNKKLAEFSHILAISKDEEAIKEALDSLKNTYDELDKAFIRNLEKARAEQAEEEEASSSSE